MLTKIISGGQTGVDIAALRVAKRMGYKTGGTAPQGYKTLAGPNFELRDLYKLEQADTDAYAFRTRCNVQDSDGTLHIARSFDTYGEKCTLKNVNYYGKPYYDIFLHAHPEFDRTILYGYDEAHYTNVVLWLESHEIGVLNVAGSSSPKVESAIEYLMTEILKREKQRNDT